MRLSGVVDPVDDTARAAMTKNVRDLRALGYKVKLAVTLGDQFDRPNPPDRVQAAFASADWRAKVIANLQPFAAMGDGLEIFLLEVPSSIRSGLTAFMVDLATAYRGKTPLALLAPPSVTEPSDIPGGDAFDIASIATVVDRIRLMTLDFSCCGAGPGPTIDSGWAVDVARLAQSRARSTPVDVSFPLYGTDFSDLGERPVTFLEAHATAKYFGIKPERALTGTLHFEWFEPGTGRKHITWFEDGQSTVRALRAWDDRTLPTDVGILYYGLGAEEPRLWETIARGMQ
jgi:spore germination protein YaaH